MFERSKILHKSLMKDGLFFLPEMMRELNQNHVMFEKRDTATTAVTAMSDTNTNLELINGTETMSSVSK